MFTFKKQFLFVALLVGFLLSGCATTNDVQKHESQSKEEKAIQQRARNMSDRI